MYVVSAPFMPVHWDNVVSAPFMPVHWDYWTLGQHVFAVEAE